MTEKMNNGLENGVKAPEEKKESLMGKIGKGVKNVGTKVVNTTKTVVEKTWKFALGVGAGVLLKGFLDSRADDTFYDVDSPETEESNSEEQA